MFSVVILAVIFSNQSIDNVYGANVILMEAGRFPTVKILNLVKAGVISDENNK